LRSGGEVPAVNEHAADTPAARAVEERRGRRVPVHRDDELLPDQVPNRGSCDGGSRRNGEENDGGERCRREAKGHTKDANARESPLRNRTETVRRMTRLGRDAGRAAGFPNGPTRP